MRTAIIAALLALQAVAPAAAATRSLQQTQQVLARGPKPAQNNGNRRGSIFNFKTNKNAIEEFERIDNKFGVNFLQRTMRNSNYMGDRLKLARELEGDDDMGIDLDNEALIFRCQGLAVNVSTATLRAAEIASGVGPGDADPPQTNAWTLSSRPNAIKKLWLDFTGGTINGSAWNAATGLADIDIPPYDKDDNPSSFSNDELNDIVAIWRGVAEDYAPFDVDVTTIPQTNTNPTLYMRVMIGGDGSWYSPAGGVAYVGVFGRADTYYQPAFVFPKQLGPDYAKYVWEAASHEGGHTMGLTHDGTRTVPYWEGNNANYASIMGVGYYKQLTVWDRGEYARANNRQDDVAIIASKLGYITDENGNSISTATPLAVTVSGTTATGTASGVVARQGVADFFRFNTGAGTATITLKTVLPWAATAATGWVRSNLDAKVEVYNSAGLVTVLNPPSVDNTNGLGMANMPVSVAAGTYYLAVSGAGTVGSDTGYSNYGSRGQFALSVTFPAPGTNPDLDPSPSPGIQTLDATASLSCSPSGNGNGRTFSCSARVTVTSSGVAVADAVVTGRYSTAGQANGFPTVEYSARTNSAGLATFDPSPGAPRSATSMTFTVSSITLEGYQWTGPTSAVYRF